MKLEDIRIDTLVHWLCGVTFVMTLGLFGYELGKPQVVVQAATPRGVKESALNPKSDSRETLHRLPALPERYQRKVIYFGWRKKWTKPGKEFAPSRPAGKLYTAMALRHSAADQ